MNKKEYDKLYKLIFKEFNDENQISSYEEFAAFIKEMKSIKPEVNKEMKAEKRTTELYALSSGLLALALESSKENIQEQLKNYSTVYETLFTNISNDCLAIIKLLESGFEFQARILTRNLFELVYTLLVVIVNKDKCKAYFDSARLENSYDVWNKYIRMSKLNEELYNFEKKSDSEYAEMMKEARKRIYSQYSSYAHNDFMYCFIGCHSTDQTNEMVNYNLWGNYNYNAKYILSSVNDLLWMMFLYFKSFMSQDNIFNKEDFITKDNYKYWNDALFISVILDEQKRKEIDENNDKQGA